MNQARKILSETPNEVSEDVKDYSVKLIERNNRIRVTSSYPDAYCRKYAKLSMVIWCPLLDCRLSGFFHTESEAWADAVVWLNKKHKQH